MLRERRGNALCAQSAKKGGGIFTAGRGAHHQRKKKERENPVIRKEIMEERPSHRKARERRHRIIEGIERISSFAEKPAEKDK